MERYRHLLPRAKVVAVAGRMQGVRVGHRVDALLANHIFDDLLLDASVPSTVSSRLFSTMRPDASCSPMFIDTWREVLASSMPPIRQVALELAACIASVRPGVFALNDYASWRHSAPALAPIHQLSRQAMRELWSRLRTRRVSSVRHISGSMQWLTGTTNDGPR
jgi:hypothetical protein